MLGTFQCWISSFAAGGHSIGQCSLAHTPCSKDLPFRRSLPRALLADVRPQNLPLRPQRKATFLPQLLEVNSVGLSFPQRPWKFQFHSNTNHAISFLCQGSVHYVQKILKSYKGSNGINSQHSVSEAPARKLLEHSLSLHN